MADWRKLKIALRQHAVSRHIYAMAVRNYHRYKRAFPTKYSKWLKDSERFTQYMPCDQDIYFHIVCDISKATLYDAERVVESVINQIYPFWSLELLLPDDEAFKKWFDKLAKANKQLTLRVYENSSSVLSEDDIRRLKVVFEGATDRGNNWHIVLTHQFILSKSCLVEFNTFIQSKNADLNFVYSDHDELLTYKNRRNPCFKPNWNADLFLSQEYIHHCCAFNSKLFESSKLNALSFSREQLYLLILQVSKLDEVKIAHLSKVLFHKIHAVEALDHKFIQKVLDKYSDEKGITVTPNQHSGVRLRWPTHSRPLVSLIIPTRNGYEILKQAVDSIVAKTDYDNYEILIIDNQSNCTTTLAYLAELERTHENIRIYQYQYEFNYSAINNFAVEKANGSILGFINNDIEVINNEWLDEMVSHAIRTSVGCVGAKLYYPNDTIQHAGVIVGMWGCAGHSHKHYRRDSDGYCGRLRHVQNYTALTAACLLVSKDKFKSVNGFNEEDLPIQFNDVDLCLKIQQQGFRNVWTPHAELYHHESISRGRDTTSDQIIRSDKEVSYMNNTWGTKTFVDPAYNINLTLRREDFSYAARDEYVF